MRNVYVYDHHDGWEDLMFVTDHELSDIDRFCWYCEEWDQLIAVVNTREDMIKILNEHSIFENEGYYTEIYQTLMEKFDEYSSDDYVQPVIPKDELEVGLFFFPEGNFSFAGCKLSEAETYGDFLIFPESHLDVWNKYKYLKYKNLKQELDYDYYPRGRIVYRKSDETFIIYYDKCVDKEINRIARDYSNYNVILELDEHYCCHICNPDYVV